MVGTSLVGVIMGLISQSAFAQYQYTAWPPEVQPITKPFANAGRLLNEAGRFWGVGYSEGYHACPSCSSGSCSMRDKHQHGYPQLLTHLHPKLYGKNIVASNALACSQCDNATGLRHHAGHDSCVGSCRGSCQSNCGHYPPGVDHVGSASPFFWRSNVRYFHPDIAIPSSVPSANYGHAMPVESGPEGYLPNHTASPSDRGPSGNALNPWQQAQPSAEATEELQNNLPLAPAPTLGPPRLPQAALERSGQLAPPTSGAIPTDASSPAPALSMPAEQTPSQLNREPNGASADVPLGSVNSIPRPPLPARDLKDSSGDLLDEGEGPTDHKSKEISLLESSGDSIEGERPTETSREVLLPTETKKKDPAVPAVPSTPAKPKSPEVKPSKDSEKLPAEEDLLSRRRNIIRQPTRR